ncbi:MAG: transporter substrate-binding domain-containing protein [Clostridia bacterium]|nr:transporter substrate-binding domain-containing protein [Clostridia bacterium]
MKKFNLLFVFIILICITILSGCTKPKNQDVVLKSHNTETADTRWETIKEHGVINIGIVVDGLPYIEKKADGKYNGYLKDLAEEIAKKAEVDVNFIEIDSTKIPTLLQDNTIDMVMNGYTQADTVNNQLKWLKPYITNHCIIVCNKYSDIESKEDLAGKKIGIVDETLSYTTTISDVNINNDELVKFTDEKEALRALSYKRVDALIIEDSYFYYYQKYNSHNYKVLDEIIYTYTRSIGINKNYTHLFEELQNIMTDLEKEGALEKIFVKWFGKN